MDQSITETIAQDDYSEIIYSDTTLEILINNTLVYTDTVAASQNIYFASTLYNINNSIESTEFYDEDPYPKADVYDIELESERDSLKSFTKWLTTKNRN